MLILATLVLAAWGCGLAWLVQWIGSFGVEVIFFWLAVAVVTGIAAQARGRSFFGWFLIGLMTSLIGLVAVLVMRPGAPQHATARQFGSDAPQPAAPSGTPSQAVTLRARPHAKATPKIRGDGDFAVRIVASSDTEKAMLDILGRLPEPSEYLRTDAIVRIAKGGRADVVARAWVAGHLPDDVAGELALAIAADGLPPGDLAVAALITGGKDAGLRMRLDISRPVALVPS